MKNSRYRLGKLYKLGQTSNNYEEYYTEFKDQIDKELEVVKEVEVKAVEKKPKGSFFKRKGGKK